MSQDLDRKNSYRGAERWAGSTVDRGPAPAACGKAHRLLQQSLLHMLVLAVVFAAHGCGKPKTIIGRWTAGPSSCYFREDGVMFYKSSYGKKFSGRYYVDPSTSPIIVESSLRALDGSNTLKVKLEIDFITADRMRMRNLAEGDDGKPRTFSRYKEDEEGDQRETILAVPQPQRR